MRSLADIVAFNAANADRALRFGQDMFLAAAATRGDLSRARIYVGAADGSALGPHPAGSTPIWTGTGSTRCCFPARPAPRSRPRPAIRASRCRPASIGGAGRTRRTTRSASPLPAAPGASRPCCASPTPSSRRPRPAGHLQACPEPAAARLFQRAEAGRYSAPRSPAERRSRRCRHRMPIRSKSRWPPIGTGGRRISTRISATASAPRPSAPPGSAFSGWCCRAGVRSMRSTSAAAPGF